MPELPEVETIARALRPELIGKTIVGAEVRWARTIAEPSSRKFRERIRGQQIRDVGRRAKFLLLQLSKDDLLIHLRMSGDLTLRRDGISPHKHDRLILRLVDAAAEVDRGLLELAFNDTRKFGRVWLVSDMDQVTAGLGPEPLAPGFTRRELYDSLQARHRQLKPLLLDQTFLAGLGNIYTDEALHRARLHPLALSDAVTPRQAGQLYLAIRRTLREGIRRNGASIDWVYRGGDFQNHFRVYGRTGKPCPVCGTKIRRIVVGQRGTHVCPRCQRM